MLSSFSVLNKIFEFIDIQNPKNYSDIKDIKKWFLIIVMILGKLDVLFIRFYFQRLITNS